MKIEKLFYHDPIPEWFPTVVQTFELDGAFTTLTKAEYEYFDDDDNPFDNNSWIGVQRILIGMKNK